MIITTLTPVEYEALKPQIFEIFLSQSNYKSHSFEEQQNYYQKWVEIYYSKWPEWFFVCIEKDTVLGYLCACPNSEKTLTDISFKAYHLFKDYYQKYAMHFHINVKPGQTGSGIGSQMLQYLQQIARSKQIDSCHIITSAHEKNVGFYKKNGFLVVSTKVLGTHELLLMSLDLGLSFLSLNDKNLQS